MNKIGTKAFKTKFINKQKQITSLRNHKLQKSCEINIQKNTNINLKTKPMVYFH